MKLLADYHVHSNFSRFGHGKNSIEELVYRANEIGLKEIAITDHGYKHFFRTSKEKMRRARALIDDINTWSKTKVLLGFEADILNERGDLDIDEETLELIDVLGAGYHMMIHTDYAGFFGRQGKSKEAIKKATNAYINAIERYPITFISHLDSILKTDLYAIGCACRENNVFVEINERHTNWTTREAEELLRSECGFMVNSDAHIREDVGVTDFAFNLVKKFKIPVANVANVEFSKDEMSSDDLEFEKYYSEYKQKYDELEKKREEAKGGQNLGDNLSEEMETALLKIAREQGDFKYDRKDGVVDPDEIYVPDRDYDVSEENQYDNSDKEKEEVSLSEDISFEESGSDADEIKQYDELNKENEEVSLKEEVSLSESENNAVEIEQFDTEKADEQVASNEENYSADGTEEEIEKMKREASDSSLEDNQLSSLSDYGDFFSETESADNFNINNEKHRPVSVIQINRTGSGTDKPSVVSGKSGKEQESKQNQSKVKGAGLSNGLVDFSSLTGREDKK